MGVFIHAYIRTGTRRIWAEIPLKIRARATRGISRTDAAAAVAQMKIAAQSVDKLRVEENVVVDIGGIAVGVGCHKQADPRRAITRVVVSKAEVPTAVADKVTVLDLALLALIEKDTFAFGKSDDSAVDGQRRKPAEDTPALNPGRIAAHRAMHQEKGRRIRAIDTAAATRKRVER